MMLASAAAQAQQALPTPKPTPAVAPASGSSQKLTCRITREGNALKRMCMTNDEWKKVDAGIADVATGNPDPYRAMHCGGSNGAVPGITSGAAGAC